MNKKTDNKRREMSKNRKNVNVKKGAEFVEGAIDELANTGWNLFKFWLKFMMWFIIIGVAFVLLEGATMNGSLNSDTIILLVGMGAFGWGIVHLAKVIAKNKREGNYK